MWGWGSAQKHSGRLLSLIPWSVVPSKSREKATKPSPGDLPSMGDISSQMLPSTTQLRHETSRWLSDDNYNDAVYFTSLRARYSLIHTISFNSHNCPEPSVLIPFSLMRRQVSKGTHLTMCLAHRRSPGKREGKWRTQRNTATSKSWTSSVHLLSLKGLSWEYSATFSLSKVHRPRKGKS